MLVELENSGLGARLGNIYTGAPTGLAQSVGLVGPVGLWPYHFLVDRKLALPLLAYLCKAVHVHTSVRERMQPERRANYHGQLFAICRSIARSPDFPTPTIGFYVSKVFFRQDVSRMEVISTLVVAVAVSTL